ncbi:MAG: glycosyltransferase [Planctomycetes bacterium]|nr:glycosyltransferase [Planctomycetota bacterium]
MTGPYRVLYHHRIRADDGQAVHVREVIGALRRAGHTVEECALVPKAVAAASSTKRPTSLWQRLSLPRTAVEVLEILYDRRGRTMLRDRARTLAPHFVYERHALHCRSGLDVARELGVPLLLEVNSPMVLEMEKLGSLRFARRARRTERAVLAGADAVLAVTRVLADLLVEAGAPRERVHVIGNGADPDRYGAEARAAAAAIRARWELPTNAFVLGFVGYMRPWHRLDLVVDAMAQPALRPVVLVLMGRGPALGPLRELAVGRGIGDRVLALGDVPSDLLPAHQIACDAALIPAINDYASPLKLFDALAAAVPVLAPDQPNLRENVRDGETALLFPPGDAAALSARLLRLVQDRAFAARLGAAGRRALDENRWTWAGNAERIVRIHESLPQRRP